MVSFRIMDPDDSVSVWRSLLFAIFTLVRTAVEAQVEFISRAYDGSGNNPDYPEWGAAGTTQVLLLLMGVASDMPQAHL